MQPAVCSRRPSSPPFPRWSCAQTYASQSLAEPERKEEAAEEPDCFPVQPQCLHASQQRPLQVALPTWRLGLRSFSAEGAAGQASLALEIQLACRQHQLLHFAKSCSVSQKFLFQSALLGAEVAPKTQPMSIWMTPLIHPQFSLDSSQLGACGGSLQPKRPRGVAVAFQSRRRCPRLWARPCAQILGAPHWGLAALRVYSC